MRFWQAISILLASFTIATAANVPVQQRDSSGLLGKRQVVQANICATVGPLRVPGLLGVTPAVTIVSTICLCTNGGVLTADSIARLTTSFNTAQQGGLLDPIIRLTGNTATVLLNTLLGQAQNDVNNSGGRCTNTVPPNGFPACPVAGAAAGQCSFGCNTGFKVCGTGCIPTAQVCPSAARRRSLNNRNICAIGWSACPVQTVKGDTVYECVNTSTDLESCGGCPGLANAGVDCSTLPGVGTVTCVEGQCKVHNCVRGFTKPTESGCTAKLARLASGVTFQ